MQKIMFNDQYGLTKAVLDGKKTQTRRLALHSKEDMQVLDSLNLKPEDKSIVQYVINKYSRFKVGETVAVAQSYETVCNAMIKEGYGNKLNETSLFDIIDNLAGWKNKLFVKAELLPHQIHITSIRLERLQDISDEDCLKEGIKKSWWMGVSGKPLYGFGEHDDKYTSPKAAYAALIDKVSGKGTWERNPWVFVYDFELVK